jgi:thymidylate kinase
MITKPRQQTIHGAGPHVTWPENMGDRPVLDLIRSLIDALNQRNVSYVHWKSNIRLDRALAGEDDLDLLVDGRHACPALEALHQLRLREAASPLSKQTPGIRHFFGLDRQSGKVVHVHLHFRLVLGHDATKNYHLPLERAMLDSAVRDALLPVPAAEFEFILYTIRSVLKHTFLPMPKSRHARSRAREELDYLESRAQRDEVDRILDQHLPCVDIQLFDTCLNSIRAHASVARRIRTRTKLHVALAAYARRPWYVDHWLKFTRLATACLRRARLVPAEKKWLVDGGAIVAVVGGDGAGKSTVIRHLENHFGKIVATNRVHLGKPTPGWTTWAVRILLAGDRYVQRVFSRQGACPTSAPRGRTSFLLALRHVCQARDRYRAYARVRRRASRGALVICDRWPVRGFQRMEAPQLADPVWDRHDGLLLRTFRRAEAHIYRRIPLPDKLIVLRVDPDVSAARKPHEPADWLRARCREVWDFDWDHTDAHVIDAGRPLPDVVLEAISASWTVL